MAKGPAWKYTAEDEAGLLYLALAAREHCGQQQSPLHIETDSEDESCDENDIAGTGNHGDPDQPTVVSSEAFTAEDSPRVRMKKQFLDNFAELLSRRKDPSYVSSCALVESEKKAKLFVARNAGFGHASGERPLESVDLAFFEAFKKHALDLRRDYTTARAEAFYELLVEYYRPRLSHHIKELCSIPTKPANHIPPFSSSPQAKRSRQFFSLRDLLKSSRGKTPGTKNLREFATTAYKLSRAAEIEMVMRSIFQVGQADRALRQLRFLARIRAIFLSILETIQTTPSFQRIDIIPIPKTREYAACSAGVDSARECALQLLRRYLGSVPEFFGHSDLAEKLQKAFYGQSLIVHTEIQTALFFDANKGYSPFPYIGVSKKPCYLCSVFLANFRLSDLGAFETRPGHGHLHPFWTLPRGLQVRKQKLHSPAMAFAAVQQRLAELISKKNVTKLAPVPQSSVVRSGRPVMSSGAVSAISTLPPTRPDCERIGGSLPRHVMQTAIRVRGSGGPVNGPTATIDMPQVAGNISNPMVKHEGLGNIANLRLGLVMDCYRCIAKNYHKTYRK